MVVCNLAAQQVPFNAIFLISDPMQKWRLLANFVLYFLPFLAGALYLGTVFLKAQKTFNRVYFADLVGSGLCGLSVLLAMYFYRPDDLIMAPLLLWLVGGVLWFTSIGDRRGMAAIVGVALLTAAVHYCSAAGARHPQARGVGLQGRRLRPQVPRCPAHLRARLAVRLPRSLFELLPAFRRRAVRQRGVQPAQHAGQRLSRPLHRRGRPVGRHQGPAGRQTAYFRYLPMYYPYVLKQKPDTFVVQFGGGLSTAVALKSGSEHVTVAEGNPAVLTAFREDKGLRDFTGDVLNNPKVTVIDYDGRLYVAHTKNRYDVIDLSLADSAGLSSPGGFSIVEKYPTRARR